MKVRQKWAIAIFFIFSGVLTLTSSQYSTNMEIQNTTENGKEYAIYAPIVFGATLTRYYEVGEKISLRLTPMARTPAVPDLFPLNFTIIAPGGNETIFVYWLEPYFNPYLPPSEFPTLIVTDLTILKVEKLIFDNSSKPKFVGVVAENGNYTLMFTSNYAQENSPLNYLALSKIAVEKEYPYTFMMPLGIGFIAIGLILTPWIIKSSQKKPHQEFADKKKKRSRTEKRGT